MKLIKEQFEADPYVPMNKVAKEMSVANSTITKAFKDLGLKSLVQVRIESDLFRLIRLLYRVTTINVTRKGRVGRAA